ncbi:CpsD/CapB family tyrosine-protein kinase [Listeria grandensis]|uniref:CpsD/CapB family tyrosine-protein kinase n=1 Tax=Listeria grandensis TaxID=1494963 RepID=A0A7X0Y4P8_9LIST|nr:CpsD/CapB family tyrosine-protein kinase [Listeria grandensis]MBC1936808.1 CpsD/CapB family tyrosine-protein kinase [Listeria grandensis]
MLHAKKRVKDKAHEHSSSISEQFKLIRTGIDFSGIDEKKQIILITSPESGTGKSTIASHLAVTYAEKGARTLLIDADMRKPTLHKHFSKNMLTGLSSVITGEDTLEDSLQKVMMTTCSFSVLTSGPIPPNPNDLLSSRKMSELIERLRGSFDKIIIDTPPVIIVSDALVLLDQVDGTVLVCRYHKTLKEKAKDAVNQLQHARANLIGVIFNATKNAENYYY